MEYADKPDYALISGIFERTMKRRGVRETAVLSPLISRDGSVLSLRNNSPVLPGLAEISSRNII